MGPQISHESDGRKCALGLSRQRAVQGISQQGFKLAALHSVLAVVIHKLPYSKLLIHVLPASYYEKVISQVPFFRG